MRIIGRFLMVAATLVVVVFGSDGAARPAQAAGMHYNRDAAVSWALQHARDAQPGWDACAWFVSNALWRGGMRQTSQWNGSISRFTLPGTKTATVARDLTNYLRWVQKPAPRWRRMNFYTNAASLARRGDLIAYDWKGDGHIDHMTIIVRIAPGQYPEVSEWGTMHPRASYIKRGWTWSVKDKSWLTELDRYKNVQAWLLHFEVP